jgi:hypothetical protein
MTDSEEEQAAAIFSQLANILGLYLTGREQEVGLTLTKLRIKKADRPAGEKSRDRTIDHTHGQAMRKPPLKTAKGHSA